MTLHSKNLSQNPRQGTLNLIERLVKNTDHTDAAPSKHTGRGSLTDWIR